jgi:hypothetical protein
MSYSLLRDVNLSSLIYCHCVAYIKCSLGSACWLHIRSFGHDCTEHYKVACFEKKRSYSFYELVHIP